MDKIIAYLGIMPYVDRFSQNFPQARWSVSYLLMYTWHTLLHYPHGANAGCELAGVAPVRGITLKSSKFLFGMTEIEFDGCILSQDGYRIHPDLTPVIRDFPLPSNWTDLRFFFYLANQLSIFIDEIAKKVEPLSDLLKQKNELQWGHCSRSSIRGN